MNPELEAYQQSLDNANKLASLKELPDWSIVEGTVNMLIADLANQLLNDAPVDHDTYVQVRYKIEGLRMIISAFKSIEASGQQAADNIENISGK
jgi:hypothetical protein